MIVTKVADKTFIGKDIIHVEVFNKNDDRTTYNMVYMDGKTGVVYAKRFNVGGVTRDKPYALAGNEKGSKMLYFTSNPNGEAEVVTIVLSSGCSARIKTFDFYFEQLAIKGRSSKGNQVTKYPVRNVKFKEAGKSTLSAPEIWYDEQVGRLNTDGYGVLLGRFRTDDRIIVFYQDGNYELTDFDLGNRYESEQILLLEKFRMEKPITAIYWDEEKGMNMVKRFMMETQTLKTRFNFIREGKKNKLVFVTQQEPPVVLITAGAGKDKLTEEIDLSEKANVSGWKAVGNKLWDKTLKSVESVKSEEVLENQEIETEMDAAKNDFTINDAPTLFE
jgi:topoisomerase-4 subunit A